MYYGKRREMLPYFAFIEYPCPAYKNPADYYREFRIFHFIKLYLGLGAGDQNKPDRTAI